jgi:hypothetical protein
LARRIQKTLGLALLVVGLCLSSVASAEACSCLLDPAPACEQYKKLDIAFVGRAISVPPNNAGGQVRFQVTRALKGVAGPEVSVLNEESGVGCGYMFRQGDDYVIFARRNAQGVIDIGRCSSTVWLVSVPDFADSTFRRRSAEAVGFAESLGRPAEGGRVFGEVWLAVPFISPDDSDYGQKPVDGATVILRGPEQRRTTSVNGGYEFTGLPPGTYHVSVAMPDGLPPAHSARRPIDPGSSLDVLSSYHDRPENTRSVTIDDPRSCGYAPFAASFSGEISGSIVNHDGTPAGIIVVELFPSTIDLRRQTSFRGPSTYTDSLGAFRFKHLPPGRYVVGINLRNAPGRVPATPYRQPGNDQPLTTELGNGSSVDLGVLRLPPASVKR